MNEDACDVMVFVMPRNEKPVMIHGFCVFSGYLGSLPEGLEAFDVFRF